MFSVPAQTRFLDPASVVRASNSFINLQETIRINCTRCRRGNVLHLNPLDTNGVTGKTGVTEAGIYGVDDDFGAGEVREGLNVENVDS
jgi:hypothetical protein